MRQTRTIAQLEAHEETPASIRAQLDANDARMSFLCQTEDGAKEFDRMQRTLVEELAILEGRHSNN